MKRLRALGWASKAGATSKEDAAKIYESYRKMKDMTDDIYKMPSAYQDVPNRTTDNTRAPSDAARGDVGTALKALEMLWQHTGLTYEEGRAAYDVLKAALHAPVPIKPNYFLCFLRLKR